MLPNTITLPSTLVSYHTMFYIILFTYLDIIYLFFLHFQPRVKNKTYDQNAEHIAYSKSADFQKVRKSWPLAQVVECVTLETVSHISPSKSENESYSTDPISVHNGCVTVLQTDNFQLGCVKESCENIPTNNVLKIVLPLVNENVPLSCQPKIIEHDEFLPNQCHIMSSNMHVQCSPNEYDTDITVNFTNKSVSNRNSSLPEDSEINRFSSTFENIKALLKEGLVDGLDEMPPDFQPPIPPLYRVLSLPNLSHDSTKHHSCSYLTMCATKQELLVNKFCKNIVKHDMSVQVSTEILKHQNEKIFVNTSCQTEDIFTNGLVNDGETKEISHSVLQTSSNVATKECEVNVIDKNEIKNNMDKDCNSIGDTFINIFNKEHKLEIDSEKNCASIGYTNITTLNEDQKLNINSEKDCSNIGYTNINVFSTEIKANGEEDCIYDYSDVNMYSRVSEVDANEEDCTSIGYTNINVFNNREVKLNKKDDCCANVSYTNITSINEPSEKKFINDKDTDIDYKNINVIQRSDEIKVNEHSSDVGYININAFDKELELKTNGEDCVDMGFKDFSTYKKGPKLGSNGDCVKYTNASNILEEFVNEQLSLNNADGDFDSFLFGPLPPSPIEEIGKIVHNNYYCFL